jgi:hypothetical protein
LLGDNSAERVVVTARVPPHLEKTRVFAHEFGFVCVKRPRGASERSPERSEESRKPRRLWQWVCFCIFAFEVSGYRGPFAQRSTAMQCEVLRAALKTLLDDVSQ